MADLVGKSRSELNELERQKLEEFEFNHGPMSLLREAQEDGSTVVVSSRNNHKLVGTVKAFDRHSNLILQNVKELWEEPVKNNKGKVTSINKRERFVSKLFVRGDTVIMIVKP